MFLFYELEQMTTSSSYYWKAKPISARILRGLKNVQSSSYKISKFPLIFPIRIYIGLASVLCFPRQFRFRSWNRRRRFPQESSFRGSLWPLNRSKPRTASRFPVTNFLGKTQEKASYVLRLRGLEASLREVTDEWKTLTGELARSLGLTVMKC